MALKNREERRDAPRYALPKAAHATFGGFEAELVEISLLGCQIEHVDRIAPRAHLPLRIKWRGKPYRIEATVMRSEMRAIHGKPGYASGLSFCDSVAESPAVVREIVAFLENAARSAEPDEPAMPPPAVEDEVDVVAAPYLQCRLTGGTWERLFVDTPDQPPEGFTILAPANDAEADVLCRAYQAANAGKRAQMRASFEAAIKKSA